MESLYKRLGISRDSLREKLVYMYVNEEKSQAMIAREIGCDITILEKWFKRLSIPARARSDSAFLRHQRTKNRVVISTRELHVLDGLMLGDGCLSLSCSSRSARYTHGGKYKETLLGIARELPSLTFSEPYFYDGYWFFKSLAYAQLLPVYERWYTGRVKKVPKDIVLDQECCYHWFVGDGCQSRSRYDIQLSTDSFSDECLDILVERLDALRIKASKTANHRLLVSSRDVPVFYGLVGPCRNPEYAYKWAYDSPKWTFQRVRLRGKKGERNGKESLNYWHIRPR